MGPTPTGIRHLSEARAAAHRRLTEVLAGVPAGDLAGISAGVSLILHVFEGGGV